MKLKWHKFGKNREVLEMNGRKILMVKKHKVADGYLVTVLTRTKIIQKGKFVKEKNADNYIKTFKSEMEENLKRQMG